VLIHPNLPAFAHTAEVVAFALLSMQRSRNETVLSTRQYCRSPYAVRADGLPTDERAVNRNLAEAEECVRSGPNLKRLNGLGTNGAQNATELQRRITAAHLVRQRQTGYTVECPQQAEQCNATF
jgi:hypothetical protein